MKKISVIIFSVFCTLAHAQSFEKQVIWKCDSTVDRVILCIVDGVYYFLPTDKLPLTELSIKTENVEIIKTVYKDVPDIVAYTLPVKKYLNIITEPLIYIKLKKKRPFTDSYLKLDDLNL